MVVESLGKAPSKVIQRGKNDGTQEARHRAGTAPAGPRNGKVQVFNGKMTTITGLFLFIFIYNNI
jgi:hypothetical protein